MKLSQKLSEQRRCEVILYMFLYKALVFQAIFLDSSLSSSGYISETNDRRGTKICQGMEHDMAT